MKNLEDMKKILAGKALKLEQLFKEWDEDGDGTINRKEWQKAMPTIGINHSDEMLNKLFDMFDEDGSGEIDYLELRAALRKPTLRRGGESPTPTDDEMEQRRQQLKKTASKGGGLGGSGRVSFDDSMRSEGGSKMTAAEKKAELEMKNLEDMRKMLASKALKLEQLFKEWDEDGDGQINPKEWRKAMRAVGITHNDYMLNKLFAMFDEDGSGEIDFMELRAALKKPTLKKGESNARLASSGNSLLGSSGNLLASPEPAQSAPPPPPAGPSEQDIEVAKMLIKAAEDAMATADKERAALDAEATDRLPYLEWSEDMPGDMGGPTGTAAWQERLQPAWYKSSDEAAEYGLGYLLLDDEIKLLRTEIAADKARKRAVRAAQNANLQVPASWHAKPTPLPKRPSLASLNSKSAASMAALLEAARPEPLEVPESPVAQTPAKATPGAPKGHPLSATLRDYAALAATPKPKAKGGDAAATQGQPAASPSVRSDLSEPTREWSSLEAQAAQIADSIPEKLKLFQQALRAETSRSAAAATAKLGGMDQGQLAAQRKQSEKERREVQRAAEEARAEASKEAERRGQSASLIQAVLKGKAERQEAARVAAAKRPEVEWRFGHEVTRNFDTGGHNLATFFVGQHEKVVLAEVHGNGRLVVTATDPNGSVIIEGATVYDSAAHFLSGGVAAAGKAPKAELWSAPGEFEYKFTLIQQPQPRSAPKWGGPPEGSPPPWWGAPKDQRLTMRVLFRIETSFMPTQLVAKPASLVKREAEQAAAAAARKEQKERMLSPQQLRSQSEPMIRAAAGSRVGGAPGSFVPLMSQQPPPLPPADGGGAGSPEVVAMRARASALHQQQTAAEQQKHASRLTQLDSAQGAYLARRSSGGSGDGGGGGGGGGGLKPSVSAPVLTPMFAGAPGVQPWWQQQQQQTSKQQPPPPQPVWYAQQPLPPPSQQPQLWAQQPAPKQWKPSPNLWSPQQQAPAQQNPAVSQGPDPAYFNGYASCGAPAGTVAASKKPPPKLLPMNSSDISPSLIDRGRRASLGSGNLGRQVQQRARDQ